MGYQKSLRKSAIMVGEALNNATSIMVQSLIFEAVWGKRAFLIMAQYIGTGFQILSNVSKIITISGIADLPTFINRLQ